jgi:hypothetical protein
LEGRGKKGREGRKEERKRGSKESRKELKILKDDIEGTLKDDAGIEGRY